MKYFTSYLLYIGVLILLTQHACCADTLKIHLTYKHKLNDAGQTTGYITIAQKFYTPDDTLFREISYNEITNQIEGYTFYFYRSGRLYTHEHYNAKDSLLFILRYYYDQGGFEKAVEKLVPVNQALVMTEKTENTYNTQHALLQQKKFFGKRLGSVANYQYDTNGKLMKETRTFKPAAKAPIKKESRVYSYADNAKLSTIAVAGKDESGKAYQYTETYLYNNLGLTSSVSIDNPRPGDVAKKVFKYLPTQHLSIYEERDINDKLNILLQYDYKKHYMEIGTQVSHYESL